MSIQDPTFSDVVQCIKGFQKVYYLNFVTYKHGIT